MALTFKPIPKNKTWIKQVFSAAAVRKGAVVRRDLGWVKTTASPKDLEVIC